MDELNKLADTEPELAKELIQDCDRLMSAQTSDEVKTKAQAMLDKLKGKTGAGTEAGRKWQEVAPPREEEAERPERRRLASLTI